MDFEHDYINKGLSQEEGHKKKKKHRNKKKANPQTNGDAASSHPTIEKDIGQVSPSTGGGSSGQGNKGAGAKPGASDSATPTDDGDCGGVDFEEPLNVPALSPSVLTASGPSSSPSDSGWHMDAGPSSSTNGWDDPVEGWELQPAYTGPYPESSNGKAPGDGVSSDASREPGVKVRGKGAMDRLPGRGGRSWPNRNNTYERSPRHGGGGPRGTSEGSGRKFTGRGGGSVAPRAQGWGPNGRHYDGSNVRQADRGPGHGGLRACSWDGGNGQGPALGHDNGWQYVGNNSRNSSETSSRCGAGNNKAWHQGARAQTERSLGSPGNYSPQGENGKEVYDYPASTYSDSQCSDLDHVEDDSDDAFVKDDSDTLQSHEEQKKVKWFRDFFQDLEGMSDGQLNEHERQWHCPACKGGPGAIDWFRGLAPLATHARTMRSRRVKLHRSFAEVLEEELRLRRSGASSDVGVQGAFGKWKGLREDTEVQTQMVVWPPIAVIQNTQLEQDEQLKWIGMGNKELLDMFQEYKPMKPRHAYGPQGHRGMSLLIFADTPAGYHDALRLGKHFTDSRRGREDWHRPSRLLFRPGGDRILYGYMAVKEDLDIFNRHSKGKTVVKYEIRKLQEVVVEPMQRMDEQNQQMQSLQSKVERAKEVSKTLKKTVNVVSRNLQLREQELQVLRQRAEEEHMRNKQQQADLEEYFQQDSAQLADEVFKKEAELQKLRDEFDKIHLYHCQQLEAQRSNIPNDQQQQALVDEEIVKKTEKVEGSLLEAQDFEQKLRDLEQKHHEQRLQFQKQQHHAALAFEQQINAERAAFLESVEKQMRH